MNHCKCTCGHRRDEHDGPHRIRPCGKCECMYFEPSLLCTTSYDIAVGILGTFAALLVVLALIIAIGKY